MTCEGPFVSIGMTTYNAERFVGRTLESLLSQDYDNFEVNISDNHSDDQTPVICETFARDDGRIKFVRNDTNIGANRNFARVLEMAKGTYFMSASDHDLWNPSYISKCVRVMESNTSAVLVHGLTMLIDTEGNPIRLEPDRIDTTGMKPVGRYIHVMRNLGRCNAFYGVMRRSALLKVGGPKQVLGADWLIIAHLALLGEIVQLPDVLFYRRENHGVEDRDALTKRRLADLFPRDTGQRDILPLCRELGELHLQAVEQAEMGFLDRRRAARATIQGLGLFQHKWTYRWSVLDRLIALLLPDWRLIRAVGRRLLRMVGRRSM